MNRIDPVYIPRKPPVDEALAAATEGDLDPLERLLDAVPAQGHRAPSDSDSRALTSALQGCSSSPLEPKSSGYAASPPRTPS
jgi:hypothetical protein